MKIKIITSCILFCSFLLCGCVRVIRSTVKNIETTIAETTQQTETTTAETTQQTETTSVEVTQEQETVTEEETSTEQATVLKTSYSVITAKMDVEADNIGRELEYPQLMGEDGKYDEINDLIESTVIEFNSPRYANPDDDRHCTFSCKYEIIYQTEDIISIEFTSRLSAERTAHPTDSCRGLTIDLKTGKPVTLDKYIKSTEYILEQIDAGDYVLGYGVFQAMTVDEIKTEIKDRFNDDELDTYDDNFCVDKYELYIIADDIIASDYAVIKIPLDRKTTYIYGR